MSVTTFIRIDPLPDEFLDALGQVSARYGQLEHIIALAMKRYTPGADWDEIFNEVYKLGRETAAHEALILFGIKVMDQSKEGELNDLLKRASNLAKERHEVIHACWGLDDKTEQLIGSHRGKLTPHTTESIKQLAENLFDVTEAINDITSSPETFTGGALLSAASYFPPS